MKKLVAVVVLTVASTGIWANEFIKGFHRPDGTYISGRTEIRDDDQLSRASASRDRRGDEEPEDESLVAKPQDNTLGALGNVGRRDPRVLRNAEAIEQVVEQESGQDGIAEGDTFYVRKSVANEYNERRILNSRRANEGTRDYLYNANSYITNNQKLNKYREMFQGNR